ncbi:MAG: hypothetical protein ACRCWW_11290 [Scandinavium sp.]|uniref:hypothetical protein n=1 Tax=Scandinavium sp. TaxID=2830653 RepID=UPI003F327784
MSRSKSDPLADALIGEAVLSLLKRKAPVSAGTLLAELGAMESRELDAQRRAIFPLIIADLQAVLAEKKHRETPTSEQEHREKRDIRLSEAPQQGKDNLH